MNEQFAINFITDAIYTTLIIAGPILLVTLVMGLLVGIFQAVTSINEMTLTFIPKIIAVILLMLFLLPWMMQVLMSYTIGVFNIIEMVAK
ncbi:MAG TPA: flagellar biosynthesis protein FliQ [Caldithrix sp.]|nr:flagellar biosynthesis protein FliQ [Caldithrix sp.]